MNVVSLNDRPKKPQHICFALNGDGFALFSFFFLVFFAADRTGEIYVGDAILEVSVCSLYIRAYVQVHIPLPRLIHARQVVSCRVDDAHTPLVRFYTTL